MSTSPPDSTSGRMRYQIPTHLHVPDKIALPLFGITFHVTIRQGLIFLLGWSTAFNMWRHLEGMSSFGTCGLILRLIFPVLLAVATLIFAVMRVGGRYLEEWVVLLFRYYRQPPVSLWRPVSEVTETSALSDVSVQPLEEEEKHAWL